MGQILERTNIILGGMNLSQFFAWSPNKGRLFCSNKALVLPVERIRESQGSKIVRLIHPDVPITDLRLLFFLYEVADFGPKHLSRVYRRRSTMNNIEQGTCIGVWPHTGIGVKLPM